MKENPESKPENDEILFKIGDVVNLTGLSEDQIRDYTDDFNMQIHRTKGGHRRFDKENIETLLTIKKKLTEEMWSYDQTRRWFNGDADPILHEKNFQTELEKKIDVLLEGRKRDDEFQKILVQKLEEQAKHYERLIQGLQEEHQKEIDDQRIFFENKLLENSSDVVHKIRALQLESPKETENTSLFSKLFGINKKKRG